MWFFWVVKNLLFIYIVALAIRQTDYPTGIRQPASDKSTRRVLVDAVTRRKYFKLNGCPIEIAEKYSDVGNQVTGKANPFTNIENSIIQKCYRSNYKIREYCEKMGQLPPVLAKHFFETLLAPIIEYGSKIWYTPTAAEKLSVFQRNYFRRALHVRQKTPNNAIYGDIGIYPLDIRLKNNVIKFLHHVLTLPETSPVKWVYHELEMLHDGQFDNWVKKAHGIYYEHPASNTHDISSFAKLSKNKMKSIMKKLSLDKFEEQWAADINNACTQPKLKSLKLISNLSHISICIVSPCGRQFRDSV